MKDFQKIHDNADEIFGGITRAGTEVMEKNIISSAPSNIRTHIKFSKTYKTPSDCGINTKVYISGIYLLALPEEKNFLEKVETVVLYHE